MTEKEKWFVYAPDEGPDPSSKKEKFNFMINVFVMCIILFGVMLPSVVLNLDKKEAILGSTGFIITFLMVAFIITKRIFNFIKLWNKLTRERPNIPNIKLSIPSILLLISLIFIIVIGTPLYVVSEKEEDDKMRTSGMLFFYGGIILFLGSIMTSSKLNPVFKRMLVGILILVTIATPTLLLGKEEKEDIITGLAAFFYGFGFAVLLSSILVDNRLFNLRKAFKKCGKF